jgi:hypothetical protein
MIGIIEISKISERNGLVEELNRCQRNKEECAFFAVCAVRDMFKEVTKSNERDFELTRGVLAAADQSIEDARWGSECEVPDAEEYRELMELYYKAKDAYTNAKAKLILYDLVCDILKKNALNGVGDES